MDVSVFQTRTDFRQINNPQTDKAFIIGLDLGYSSIKVITANSACCIPSFVREIHGEIVGELAPTEIAYLDEKNKKYYVGDLAFKAMKRGENITEAAMYGRNHYIAPEFLIQFRIGLALALWNEKVEENKVFIQTGLPPAYLVEDEAYLRHVIEGHHKFKVRRGNEQRSFDFTIDSKQIDVMMQPMGTFYSISTDSTGKFTADLKRYLSSNILIFDGGFGTLDKYLVQGKHVEAKETDDRLGMRRVLAEARKNILQDHPTMKVSISIPEMQECLKTGKYVYRDIINMTEQSIDVSRYIADANDLVCKEAFESIKDIVGDINILVMTGGTGAAWNKYFSDKLSRFGIEVIPGNAQSNLPYIYANARGYYMARYNLIKTA